MSFLAELIAVMLFVMGWMPIAVGMPWYCCCTPVSWGTCCGSCIDDKTPVEIEAVIAGIADGSCPCAAINGTWILVNDCTSPLQPCTWRYTLTTEEEEAIEGRFDFETCVPLDFAEVKLEVGVSAIRGEFRGTHVSPLAVIITCSWRKNYSPEQDQDCLNFSSLLLPLETGGAGQCLRNSSTMTITTVAA